MKENLNKTTVLVWDEGELMWTLLVDNDKVGLIEDLIAEKHGEYFADGNDDLRDEYGGYYDYISNELDKVEGIMVMTNVYHVEV